MSSCSCHLVVVVDQICAVVAAERNVSIEVVDEGGSVRPPLAGIDIPTRGVLCELVSLTLSSGDMPLSPAAVGPDVEFASMSECL